MCFEKGNRGTWPDLRLQDELGGRPSRVVWLSQQLLSAGSSVRERFRAYMRTGAKQISLRHYQLECGKLDQGEIKFTTLQKQNRVLSLGRPLVRRRQRTRSSVAAVHS